MASRHSLRSVSRETLEDLEAYVRLLIKWNQKINLVARSTEDHVWARHIDDSLQLWPLLPPADHLVDLGSGGGLPGLVLAICAKHDRKIARLSLVEADIRKAAFLRTVIQSLNLPATVVNSRILEGPYLAADLMTARALAPLTDLNLFAEKHMQPAGRAFFLKGEKAEEEISTAQTTWRFTLSRHPSTTDPNATILEVGDLHRV